MVLVSIYLTIFHAACETISAATHEVVDEVTNLALGAHATQSSTAFGAAAALAVDGSRDGNFWGGSSCTHTAEETGTAWWAAALGDGEAGGMATSASSAAGVVVGMHEVRSVAVHGREDACCQHRLRGLQLLLFNFSDADAVPGAGASAEVQAAPYAGPAGLGAAAPSLRSAAAAAIGQLRGVLCPTLHLGEAAGSTQETVACRGVAQAVAAFLPPLPARATPPYARSSANEPRQSRSLSLCEVEVMGRARTYAEAPLHVGQGNGAGQGTSRGSNTASGPEVHTHTGGLVEWMSNAHGATPETWGSASRGANNARSVLLQDAKDSEADARRRHELFDRLPLRQRRLVGIDRLEQRRERLETALRLNHRLLQWLLGSVSNAHPGTHLRPRARLQLLRGAGKDECDDGTRPWAGVLAHLTRDWSTLGQTARLHSHERMRSALKRRLPPPARILLPGSGLGRLGAELAAEGYSVVMVECASAAVLATLAVLNANSNADIDFEIVPSYDELGDMVHADEQDQFARARVPGADGLALLQRLAPPLSPEHGRSTGAAASSGVGRGGELALVFGTLQGTFGAARHRLGRASDSAKSSGSLLFDAVLTSFFIDTGNALSYVELFAAMLRHRGLWINLGPLHYPRMERVAAHNVEVHGRLAERVSRSTRMVVPPFAFSDVKHAAQQLGFNFEATAVLGDAPFFEYVRDATSSMNPEVYRPVFSIARKERK